MLETGLHAVPKGHLATVVTHLEMLTRPETRPAPNLPWLTFNRLEAPTPDTYRKLFRRIGQDYLWFSRLRMPDDALNALFQDPDYRFYTFQREGRDMALLELDFREKFACELAFFGLDKSLIGTGAGRLLMNHAIDLAFSETISRFHVHTCTLDSPQALMFYLRSGFIAYHQEVEIAADPRITGELPRSAAPQIPCFPENETTHDS